MHRAGLSPRRLSLGTVQEMSSAPSGLFYRNEGESLFFLTFICPLVGEGTSVTTLTWRSEDSLWDLLLSSHDIGLCRLGVHGRTL